MTLKVKMKQQSLVSADLCLFRHQTQRCLVGSSLSFLFPALISALFPYCWSCWLENSDPPLDNWQQTHRISSSGEETAFDGFLHNYPLCCLTLTPCFLDWSSNSMIITFSDPASYVMSNSLMKPLSPHILSQYPDWHSAIPRNDSKGLDWQELFWKSESLRSVVLLEEYRLRGQIHKDSNPDMAVCLQPWADYFVSLFSSL